MPQRILAALTVLVALAATLAVATFAYKAPDNVLEDTESRPIARIEEAEPLLVRVEPGASAGDIGDLLQERGIVRSGRLFSVLVALTGLDGKLEAGEYEFEPNMAAIETVRRIAAGRTASRRVNVPEGVRIEEVAEILERRDILGRQEFLDALGKARYDLPFLAQVTSESLQGFVFPATYEFRRGAPPEEIAETMLRGFQDNVADAVQLEGQNLTLLQVVTLASIIEREAATPEERPIIASVFLNRLRLGIALQADPTVQFAVAGNPISVAEFGWWKRDLTVDDLQIDSPYNTYVVQGLPPGPICNPGADAVRAVIRPAQTDYLFFVAKDNGTHVFARTIEEHLANVEQYQR